MLPTPFPDSPANGSQFSPGSLHITHLLLNITRADDLHLEVRGGGGEACKQALHFAAIMRTHSQGSPKKRCKIEGWMGWGKAPFASLTTLRGGGGEEGSSRHGDKKSTL